MATRRSHEGGFFTFQPSVVIITEKGCPKSCFHGDSESHQVSSQDEPLTGQCLKGLSQRLGVKDSVYVSVRHSMLLAGNEHP